MISVHSNQTLLTSSKSNKFLQGMSTLFTEHNSCWTSNSLCGFTTAGGSNKVETHDNSLRDSFPDQIIQRKLENY